MRGTPLTERDLRMLELLGKGDSSKAIAKKLGYRPGTTRVYLHDLYRKIGVPNKTSAVIWYFDKLKARTSGPAPETAPVARLSLEESVGDVAMRLDLFTALGAMSTLVGPFGRLWQVAARLKGASIDRATHERRAMSRQLWEALLRGDFAHGKRLFDSGGAGPLLIDSPADGVHLAALLLLGGYSNAAERVLVELARKQSRPLGPTAGDQELLAALRGIVNRADRDALVRVQRIAADTVKQPTRQTALAVLHYVCKSLDDRDGAKRAAEGLWIEAEGCLQHLQAMGERPLYRDATGAPAAPGTRSPGARRKELLSR